MSPGLPPSVGLGVQTTIPPTDVWQQGLAKEWRNVVCEYRRAYLLSLCSNVIIAETVGNSTEEVVPGITNIYCEMVSQASSGLDWGLVGETIKTRDTW